MRGRRSGTTLYRVERPGDGKVGQTPTGASDPRPRAILAPRAAVAQLARASACHAEGRGFESHQPLRKALQLAGFSFWRGFRRIARHAEGRAFEFIARSRSTS